MATKDSPEVDLTGIEDWQQPLAFGIGVLLIVVGLAGISGIFDVTGLWNENTLVFGVFGVPFWLSVTAIVAGLIGILLALYKGAGTTFNKVASGLVLPAVILLSITDWAVGVASGGGIGIVALVLGLGALLLAVVCVVIGLVLLWKRPLMFVLPVVAGLAILDWVFNITAWWTVMGDQVGARVTIPTIGLLILLAIAIGVAAFEGGSRVT